MTGRRLDTLKLERNVARAPIWAPRPGMPQQLALAWPALTFHGDAFTITDLSGTLGPTDLLVFAHLCTLYLARKPRDRRLELDTGDVARWSGATVIGGSQRRLARACLVRLRSATFTSTLRSGKRGSERHLERWRLIDGWELPGTASRCGRVRISETMAEQLDAGSVVLLDAGLLTRLARRSGLAARLWAFLETETLTERGLTRDGQPYRLFTARPGEPIPVDKRAGIADMCRLVDPRRSRSAAKLRRACELIEETDTRYVLRIESSARGREGMWNLIARRFEQPAPMGRQTVWSELPTSASRSPDGPGADDRAPSGIEPGRLGHATVAPSGMVDGRLGDAGGGPDTLIAAVSEHGSGAPSGMQRRSPDEPLQTRSSDDPLQTVPAPSRRVGPAREPRVIVKDELIERDRAILSDPLAPRWKQEAALAHLQQLGIKEVTHDAA